MADILIDSFSGAEGTLLGHAPDTPFGALTWGPVTNTLLTGSGGIKTATGTIPSSNGSATYGLYGGEFGLPWPADTNFVFTPGPSLTGANGQFGFQLTINFDNESVAFSLIGTASGWQLQILDAIYGGGSGAVNASLTPGVSYPVQLTIGESSWSASISGATTTYVRDTTPTGLGLSRIIVFLGGGESVISGLSVGDGVGALPDSIDLSISGNTPVVSSFFGASAFVSATRHAVRALMGASINSSAPSPTLRFTAHDSTGENAITAHAPSPRLTFFTGAGIKAKAPSPTLSVTGTTTNWVKAAVKPPKPIVSATATVSGMMSANIRAPSPNLIGYGGAVCSVKLTGRPTVQATVTTGSVISVAVACPLFQVTASATAQNHGSINVIAPSPRMGTTMQAWVMAPMARVTAIGSATITATYEAYAVNLNHTPVRGVDPVDEVTRYTNFPFTHVVRYKNSYYGANSTGLYLLEGTTDDGDAIEFSVKTAMTDFDSPLKKTVVSAYFAGRLGSQTTIDLHVGEDGSKTYSHATVRGEHAQNYRQKFGRGTDARYYAIGASGTGVIELDSIELMVQTSKRRI